MKKIAKLCAVTLAAILAFLPIMNVHAAEDVIVEVSGGSSSGSSDTFAAYSDSSDILAASPASTGMPDGPVEGGVSEMNKTATPIGNSADRTYSVKLTVGGDESVDAHYGNIFILVDLPALLGGNQITPYYLRAIWNMCNTIKNERPEARFCLIGYSDQVYLKSNWISDLGDPARIYSEKDTSSFFWNYKSPSADQQGTLLGELDKLTPYNTVGNLHAGTKYNNGKPDNTGMYVPDNEALAAPHPGIYGGVRVEGGGYQDAVNTEKALETVRDMIGDGNLLNNHVVMVSSTLPTASNNNPAFVHSPGQYQKSLDDALKVYYKMADTGGANFYMFAYQPFAAQQEGYSQIFDQYVNTIGHNLDSAGNSRFTAEEQEKMLCRIQWDHELGTAADPAQKLADSLQLHDELQKVSSCVSDMFTIRQEYAYGAVITDTVPEEFEIVPGSVQAIIGGTSASGVTVSGNTITWNIGEMKADAGQYMLNYQVRAKDSYFGGEVRATNTEAALEYKNASGASQKDLFPLPAVYVPWKETLTGSEHSYFYGDTPDDDTLDSLTIPAQNAAKVNGEYYAFDLKDANGVTGGSLNDFQFEWQIAEGSPLVEWTPDAGHSVIGKITSGQVEKLLYYCRPGQAAFRLRITNSKLTGFTASQGMLKNTASVAEYIAWLGGESSVQLSAYQETADVKFTIKSGTLTLHKEVINAADYTPDRVEGKKFIMRVRGPMSFDVELKHGETFTLKGLKAGQYTVTELLPQNYELDGMELNGTASGKAAVLTVSEAKPAHSVKVKNKLTNIKYFYQDIEISNKCITVDISNNE